MTPESLLDAADRCVKCGVCLPHCPTYRVYRDEAESPRGRIALIQAMVGGQLEASQQLRRHLEHCLLCRNCEKACPSLVQYGALMDAARARLAGDRRPGWLLSLLTDRRRLGVAVGLGAKFQRSPLRKALPGTWRRMARWALRAARQPVNEVRPPEGGRGRVLIFTGCVSAVIDRNLISAARRLLETLGYAVTETDEPQCCGAMHLHSGYAAEAGRLLERTCNLLGRSGVDAVLSVASGCGARLVEDAGLDVPVRDIGGFLADVEWPDDLLRTMPPATVALHQPCTLRNVMGEAPQVLRLLERFRSVTVIPLDGGCCGGAGMHLVEHPDLAASVAGPLIERLRDTPVDHLLTSNTGCSLHLATEAAAAGLTVRVAHPVEFIATQLGIWPGPTAHTGTDHD